MVHPLQERADTPRGVRERLSSHAGHRPGRDCVDTEIAARGIGTGSSAGNRPENHPGTGTGTGIPVGYRDKAREAGEAWTYPGGAPVVSADAEEVVWGMEIVRVVRTNRKCIYFLYT